MEKKKNNYTAIGSGTGVALGVMVSMVFDIDLIYGLIFGAIIGLIGGGGADLFLGNKEEKKENQE